jgi:N-acetylglutamate synthase-like GNAT family acetyltransferase
MAIRQARHSDAPRIVELIRCSFEPHILELFIYGCDGVTRFVEHQIAARAVGGDTAYFVAEADERVIACAEIRRVSDRLFLNYIAVDPSARAHGTGRSLLATALAALHTTESRLVLDVLEDNKIARSWYDSLGLVTEAVTCWYRLARPRAAHAPGIIVGLPQARACHAMFGFSQVTIDCGSKSYAVGMLGEHLYRLTDPAAVRDDALLAALHRLDDSRDLLLLAAGHVALDATPVARTERRVAALDGVLSRLDRT